jgi:hypothetical protein
MTGNLIEDQTEAIPKRLDRLLQTALDDANYHARRAWRRSIAAVAPARRPNLGQSATVPEQQRQFAQPAFMAEQLAVPHWQAR